MDSEPRLSKTKAFWTTLIQGKRLKDIPGIGNFTAELLNENGYCMPEEVFDHCRKTLDMDRVRFINWFRSFGIRKENARVVFMALDGYLTNESQIPKF